MSQARAFSQEFAVTLKKYDEWCRSKSDIDILETHIKYICKKNAYAFGIDSFWQYSIDQGYLICFTDLSLIQIGYSSYENFSIFDRANFETLADVHSWWLKMNSKIIWSCNDIVREPICFECEWRGPNFVACSEHGERSEQ